MTPHRDSDIGLWEFGTTLDTGMIIVVTLQLLMVSKSVTVLNGMALAGSVLLWFFFEYVFATLPTELYWVAYMNAQYVNLFCLSVALFLSIALPPSPSPLPPHCQWCKVQKRAWAP